MGMAVHVDALSRRFGPRWVLVRATTTFPEGSATWLRGANGAGKTTLLRCLATALRPHDGAIRVDGADLWANRARLRPAISFLSHASRLYEDLTARDNLRFWAGLRDRARHPDELLRRVGLEPSRPEPVRTFSAGMKRRLALARTLLQSPALALFDEPHSSLDPDGRALVDAILTELVSAGTTVIVASHHAVTVCDRALELVDGRVVEGSA